MNVKMKTLIVMKTLLGVLFRASPCFEHSCSIILATSCSSSEVPFFYVIPLPNTVLRRRLLKTPAGAGPRGRGCNHSVSLLGLPGVQNDHEE